jgi:hypothetical protein
MALKNIVKTEALSYSKQSVCMQNNQFDGLNLLEIYQLFSKYIQEGNEQKADEIFEYIKYYWPDHVED